jgi:hypothetical protein
LSKAHPPTPRQWSCLRHPRLQTGATPGRQQHSTWQFTWAAHKCTQSVVLVCFAEQQHVGSVLQLLRCVVKTNGSFVNQHYVSRHWHASPAAPAHVAVCHLVHLCIELSLLIWLCVEHVGPRQAADQVRSSGGRERLGKARSICQEALCLRDRTANQSGLQGTASLASKARWLPSALC